eukprot:gnl/Spiro4/16611_TR8947_c0_g1_i1.p1 gnl/Spiro4/16611_TR8947_c0_g1~~gnl/Spiro4/16611_TR8947_c0_g1_i1.p1  ORF type:complete len:393 (-),score=88.62 gnl/Spiro4/16611_TR8947_c0_g1_i1:151-1329(-)
MGEGFGDVQFHIPQGMKSYGLVTMLFFMQFPELSTATIAYSGRPLDPDRAVIILDDFAGSGLSLREAAASIVRLGQKAPIFAAPLIETSSARLKINADTESVSGFLMTKDYLPPFVAWMGERGFGGHYFVALPYMAPDNDASFMSYIVAPLLTFGGLGAKQESAKPPRFAEFMALLHDRKPAPPLELADLLTEDKLDSPPNEFFAYLCSEKGRKRKFPVVLEHGSLKASVLPQRPTVVEAARSVGNVFNWVIPKNRKLVLGLLTKNNPLQLGVSFAELAYDENNQDSKLYLGGQVKVGEFTFEFSLDERFDERYKPQQIATVLKHLIPDSLAKGFSVGSFDLFDAGWPTPEHFREACEKRYKLRLLSSKWNEERDGELPEDEDACKFQHQCK